MLNKKEMNMTLSKLDRFCGTLDPLLFRPVASPEIEYRVADDVCRGEFPSDGWAPAPAGTEWGGEGKYCLTRMSFTVPPELEGRKLFLRPKMGFYEALFYVNGAAYGTFTTKIVQTGHGNHYCDMFTMGAPAGTVFDLVVEAYAGHRIPGCMPLQQNDYTDFRYTIDGADVCERDEQIADFLFDLKTLCELAEHLPQDSFRHADVIRCLYKVHRTVLYSPDDADPEEFRSRLAAASPVMKRTLAVKNSDSVPTCGIIGHSHMDTAWLWHIGETVNKCARTYSEALSMMEQYPEYMFVQSSALHSEMMRLYYPELFERIRDAVTAGRYEPNGGVWVECDCNITGGEAMVRQFLWGQRFTMKYFGYKADSFWLPDTFGYSAAIPQIMKKCGVDYFLTTKIAWNDTNEFPYDSFIWEGIDGTRVLAHFNKTHVISDAEDIIVYADRDIKQKPVAKTRLVSYGYGDGGGGPEFSMIEMARRIADCDGVPKTRHMSVSEFMHTLEKEITEPNVYCGELYLELHRGTLTNQHTIKRNNRKAEFALRDLEAAIVSRALARREAADDTLSNELWEKLLKNQFHDILPGSAIHRVHAESRAEMGAAIVTAGMRTKALLDEGSYGFSLVNTLSFDRTGPIVIDRAPFEALKGVEAQTSYETFDGGRRYIACGIGLPAFSSRHFSPARKASAPSVFSFDGDALETPFALVRFAPDGSIASFVDKPSGRELVAPGGRLNRFAMAEDLPEAWDNWNYDADTVCRFADAGKLLSREVAVDDGCAFVLRSEYAISAKSTLRQDMIFFASFPEVRFDTEIDWQDDHRFLKTFFDLDVRSGFARHEIQFGSVLRPTTRNNSLEQAKFEVVNHKFTDISETRFGVSILNDCKYGISVDSSGDHGCSAGLSLHKGGNRPDDEGDHDCPHRCEYALLPHVGAFSAESVVRPAYELNSPALAVSGNSGFSIPIRVGAPNVIVESVKPCEDASTAFIARLYECEGAKTVCPIELPEHTVAVETDMLEEPLGTAPVAGELTFNGFEIKTLKVCY